jgi:hypothetical protein
MTQHTLTHPLEFIRLRPIREAARGVCLCGEVVRPETGGCSTLTCSRFGGLDDSSAQQVLNWIPYVVGVLIHVFAIGDLLF